MIVLDTNVLIEILKDKFSVLPKDLIVHIGPGIGSCCYEIKEDIIKIVKAIIIIMKLLQVYFG